jgi:hypothetical protein
LFVISGNHKSCNQAKAELEKNILDLKSRIKNESFVPLPGAPNFALAAVLGQ